MPVVAVLPAILAVGGVAAGAASGVLVGTTLAFAVVGAVGATLGAVGAVTKNKTLGYIGMGLGAIGAVGGLASAAGVFSEGGLFSSAASGAVDTTSSFTSGIAGEQGAIPAASAANEAAVEAAYPGQWGVPEVAAPAGVPATEPVGDANMRNPPTDQTTLVDDTKTTGAAQVAADKPQVQADGTNTAQAAVDNPLQTGTKPDPSLPDAPPAPPGEAGGTAASKAPAPQWGPDNSLKYTENPNAPGSGTLSPKTGLDKIGDTFEQVASWADKHKVFTEGMIKGAGALMQGLTPTTTAAQAANFTANAEANNALAKMREQQMANIAAPKAVAFSPPVTGAPAQNAWGYASPGLINRAPTANVTGAAA